MEEKLVVFCYALMIGMFFFLLAYKKGFFSSFQSSQFPLIWGKELAWGFSAYLLSQLILMPFLIGLTFHLTGKSFNDFYTLDPLTKGWWNLIFMSGGFLSIIPVYLSLPSYKREQLRSQTSTPWHKHIAIGIASWFVIFPLTTAVNQLISLVTFYFLQHPEKEQLVIQQMRQLSSSHLLFGCLGLTIVALVPLTEEFLFRGLLQNWLKRNLNHATAAVLISSLIFSCFHFSISLGWSNIELLPTLFLLSCMLGYLYERQRSLWASVGLHGFYNLVTLISIYVGLE